MAELNKKMFGNLKGKFGDAVFRQRNGKNFISQRPQSYTVPEDESFRNRTAKFKLAVKLASAINSINELKNIWYGFITDGKTPFQHLVRNNYPLLEPENVSSLIKIVPDSGFGARINSFTLNSTSLSLSLNPLGTASNVDVSIEKKIQLIALVFMNNPSAEGINRYEFLKFISAKVDFNLVEPVSFAMELSTADSDLFEQYQDKRAFFSLLTYDESDLIVNYAKTFSSVVS